MTDLPDAPPPRRAASHPTAPSILAAMMIGMEKALFDREPNPVVEVVDQSGLDEEPIRLYLHPDIPEASLILIRLPRPMPGADA